MPDQNFVMEYRILDAKKGVPKRRFLVHASSAEIGLLIEKGYIIRRRLIRIQEIEQFRKALSRIERQQRSRGNRQVNNCFNSVYLRHLLDMDKLFFKLFELKQPLSIARAVLGPQVKFDEITARVTDLAMDSAATPWHIHLRVVPDPLPPFFSYPHAIECLLYLDDVTPDAGPICVLPGSHNRINSIYPANDTTDKAGQEILSLNTGDCLIMHSNLWHRALPSTRKSGLRRLIIFGYVPSWIWGEERGSIRPRRDALAKKRLHENASIRELAGEFFWG
jgi:ectoine hydroxylase-related dioxygenase (phytanoyl-CoA dioxygenase family)